MALGFFKAASGLIAARFLRPDARDRFLIEFALACVDQVALFLCSRDDDPVPADERHAWLRQNFPAVPLFTLHLARSASPADGRETMSPWVDLIAAEATGRRFDVVFSSGIAESQVAERLGATVVPVFPPPELVTQETTPARAHPTADAARLLRVCLFGPESTGKSTLAAALARHYRTLHVPEYVRGYLDATGSPGTLADVPWIARGQHAAEVALAAHANRILFCDTNLATIALWSDVLFGTTPGWIRECARTQSYDLWLLTGIDVPFEADPQRCFPAPKQRAWFMRRCLETLDQLGVTPLRLSGTPGIRLQQACAAIDRLLALRTGGDGAGAGS